MSAYVVFTRTRTIDQKELETYCGLESKQRWRVILSTCS